MGNSSETSIPSLSSETRGGGARCLSERKGSELSVDSGGGNYKGADVHSVDAEYLGMPKRET